MKVHTPNCSSQVYTPTHPPPAGGVFRLILEGASAATNSELRVGFSADGPPGVKLLTSKTPPGPAPPTPLLSVAISLPVFDFGFVHFYYCTFP